MLHPRKRNFIQATKGAEISELFDGLSLVRKKYKRSAEETWSTASTEVLEQNDKIQDIEPLNENFMEVDCVNMDQEKNMVEQYYQKVNKNLTRLMFG